jgi:hypothetical protein
MKFSLTFISRDMAMSNAARRIYPARDALKQALAECELTSSRYQYVIMGVTDNPLVFYSEQKSQRGYVTITVGVDPTLTFSPEEDDKFLDFVLGRVRHFANRSKGAGGSKLSEEDAALILKACDEIAGKYMKQQ